MSKILISTLGTGNRENISKINDYRVTNYIFPDSKNLYNTKFIIEALVKERQPDKIIVLGSNQSLWDGLCNVLLEDKGYDQDIILEKTMHLIEKLENKLLKDDSDEDMKMFNSVLSEYAERNTEKKNVSVKSYILEYGQNEEEIKKNVDIFMDILNHLENGDEIYFDITHMFRSIPLFAFIMLQFIEALDTKSIKIKELYYGMYEAREKNEYGMEIAPIVDLSYLLELSKWISATQDFVDNGNAKKLSNLLEVNGTNQKVAKELSKVSAMLKMNFLHEFKRTIPSLRGAIRSAEDDRGLFKYVEPNIVRMLNRFEYENTNERHENSKRKKIKEESKSQMELSKWYFEHENYGFGYLCLEEAIITRLCEIYEVSENKMNDFNYRMNLKARVFTTKNRKGILNKDIKDLFILQGIINSLRCKIAHVSIATDENREREKTSLYSSNKKIQNLETLAEGAEKDYKEVERILYKGDLNRIKDYISLEEIEKPRNR